MWKTLLVLLCGVQLVDCNFTQSVEVLRTALLTASYTVEVRPSNVTNVTVQMLLVSLNRLSTADQSMSVTALWYMTWSDERLSWNSSTFSNIQSMVVSQTEVWTPPIVIMNVVEKIGPIKSDAPIRVSYTGGLEWTPPATIETSCDVVISNYPFDIQTCSIKLVVWAYTRSQVGLRLPESEDVSVDSYSEHGGWQLIKQDADTETFTAGSKEYGMLNFKLTFRRRWEYHGLTLLLPLALSSLMMAAVFAVPIESGEKIGYSLTVLLSFTLVMTVISESIPAISTQVSIIQGYLCTVLTLGTMITLLTTLNLYLYHKEEGKPVSRGWLVVYKILSLITCLGRIQRKRKKSVSVKPVGSAEDPITECSSTSGISTTATMTTGVSSAWTKKEDKVIFADDVVTWQDLARRFDAAFFRIFTVLFIAIAALMIVGMYIMYYTYS